MCKVYLVQRSSPPFSFILPTPWGLSAPFHWSYSASTRALKSLARTNSSLLAFGNGRKWLTEKLVELIFMLTTRHKCRGVRWQYGQTPLVNADTQGPEVRGERLLGCSIRDAGAAVRQGAVIELRAMETHKKQNNLTNYYSFCLATMLTSKIITGIIATPSEFPQCANSCNKFVSMRYW